MPLRGGKKLSTVLYAEGTCVRTSMRRQTDFCAGGLEVGYLARGVEFYTSILPAMGNAHSSPNGRTKTYSQASQR